MRLVVLSFALLPTLLGNAQSPVRDSSNYVLLMDGQKLYSHNIRLKHTSAADQYLELADHTTIPIEKVSRFQSPHGAFVTVPGSTGPDIYKVEKEGPRVSLYSKTYIDPVHAYDSGYIPTRSYYFRKTGEEKMSIMTYPGLRTALSDNPASIRELQLYQQNKQVGIGIAIASVIIETIGVVSTFHSKTKAAENTQPGQASVTTTTVSPLVFIGAGGLVASFVLVLGAHHHQTKAMDVYNR